MSKKISDIQYRPPPPPNPPTPEQLVLKHLEAHPDDGFTSYELATACGILPKIDSLGAAGSYLLGTLIVHAAGLAPEGPPPLERFEKMLAKLVKEEAIATGPDRYGIVHYWLADSKKSRL